MALCQPSLTRGNPAEQVLVPLSTRPHLVKRRCKPALVSLFRIERDHGSTGLPNHHASFPAVFRRCPRTFFQETIESVSVKIWAYGGREKGIGRRSGSFQSLRNCVAWVRTCLVKAILREVLCRGGTISRSVGTKSFHKGRLPSLSGSWSSFQSSSTSAPNAMSSKKRPRGLAIGVYKRQGAA